MSGGPLEDSSSARRLALPAAVVRSALGALRVEWLAALAGGGAIVVDGANVLEVDGPGVQLLLALDKSARERGVEVRLVDRSKVLAQALAAHRVEWVLS